MTERLSCGPVYLQAADFPSLAKKAVDKPARADYNTIC